VQCAAFAQLHADHLALGLLGGFANGLGDLFRFTFAETNAAFLVTYDNKCRETKALTTFNGFGHTVDRDQAVGKFWVFIPVATWAAAVIVTFCHENILVLGGFRRLLQSR
jgi:hypothetical protein